MTYAPVIRSQSDLEAAWRHLMEPLGFGGCSLWLMLVQPDDRPVPSITEIQECDGEPDPEFMRSFAHMLSHMTSEPGTRWAVLRSRPGRGGIDELDRAWARGIYEATRDAGVPVEVVHLATDDTLVPIPMDEVGYVRAS